jgi:hypothetical protein
MRPNVASTIGRTRVASTAPTTTSTMSFGTRVLPVELLQPGRVSFWMNSRSPRSGPPVRMRRVAHLIQAPDQKLLRVVLDEVHLLEDHLFLVVDLRGRKARVVAMSASSSTPARRCSTGTTKS